ncbi:hypothetical protein DFH94DRAFT_395841 [Russula ochroleuca]|uniref:Fe2OG dioxygenase domain-containing protein n=1 Tax=Russula ochroleuca TaxID=152965 RepID=A0A9P5JV12_9AGAM|nr:hypothetical protein DFH94DRAFT_395841 [Russula ochroleuca]
METETRTHLLLTSLRESIIEKPPYISGRLQLPASYFSLFYRVAKDGPAARYINLANATPDELEQLTQACEPTSFGKKHEVLDGTYRKPGKMDSERFAPMLDPLHTDLMKIIYDCLLEGTQSTRRIKTELHELSVYSTHSIFIHLHLISCCYPGEGSFFKPHVDTPRSKKMFGSLVIVFPTPHEGGALLLRHRGHEWIFDPGQELASKGQPSIGYVAFLSDIEHEVAPVISGHCITLTYNLYFDDGGPVSANDAVSEHLTPLRLANEDAFRDAFLALLENPEFLAEGGTLAFGLRHVYPIKKNLKHVYSILKGSDAVVYRKVCALGYEPVLYVFYEPDKASDADHGMIIDKVINFDKLDPEDNDDLFGIVFREGGSLVYEERGGGSKIETSWGELPEQLEWVTPRTTFNRQKDLFKSYDEGPYGEEAVYITAHWNVCLVVRIGMAGDRLAYRTVAELNRKNKKTQGRYWY